MSFLICASCLSTGNQCDNVVNTFLFRNRNDIRCQCLERDSQVHFVAESQDLLDFIPAPKLDIFGK